MRIILLLLFIWIGRISADNPVMCMLHQIVGHWTFVLDSSDEGVFKKDLHSPKISCHKGQPGRVLKISAKDDLRFKQSTKLFVEFTQNSKFNLYDDEKVIAGNYTLLIHEGFMAFVNNTVFMNFWRYNYEGNDTFDSVCYKTMIGWYHTIAQKEGEEEKWGCFYGYKYHIFDADVDTKNHVKMNYDGPIRPNKINNMNIANKLVKMSKQGKLLFTLDDDIFHFKNKINKSNSDSKLSKSEIEIKSTAYKDAVKNKETIIDQFYGRDTSSITEEQLPENLNWADVNGESFFPEIIHQKCGECYLDSFVQVYQSRVRIKTRNKLKPNISIQHIIDCNFYSEGCDGGFAISAAKFAWEFFLVDDECYSTNCQHDDINLNNTKEQQCCDKCDNQKIKYTVESFKVIGGYYGATTELEMMKEILTQGPITGMINAPGYVDRYKSGILHSIMPINENDYSLISDHQITSFIHASNKNIKKSNIGQKVKNKNRYNSSICMYLHRFDEPSTLCMRENDYEYEYLNHAVVIVGWGFDEETNTKYWICANTWGKNWGENGFFRLQRGTDEFSIESTAESFVPKITYV